MNKLASIEIIKEITNHPNGDNLEIAKILNYNIIVRKNLFSVGEKVILFGPDAVFPSDAEWAKQYSKINRVKPIKIRGEWSFGIVEKLNTVFGNSIPNSELFEVGKDISHLIGVTKYETPIKNHGDLKAIGNLPHGLYKTDEENFHSLENLPIGELCDVTLKIDGSSFTAFVKVDENGSVLDKGVCSRNLNLDLNSDNIYTRVERKYNILEKLTKYCSENKVSLAIRGEIYGKGIQEKDINSFSKLPLSIAFFSVYDLDNHRYFSKGENLYFVNLCKELNLPYVPIIENNVVFSMELLNKYHKILNHYEGKPFEGVVINFSLPNPYKIRSFKILNNYYNSKY